MLTRGTMGVARKVVCGQRVGRNRGDFGVGSALILSKAAVSLLLGGDKKSFLDKLLTLFHSCNLQLVDFHQRVS